MKTVKMENMKNTDMFNQELGYFRIILNETRDKCENIDNISTEDIFKLLEDREEWIKNIRFIEFEAGARSSQDTTATEELFSEISQIVEKLKHYDSKIYEFLNTRKLHVIREMITLLDKKVKKRDLLIRRESTSRLIDLKQA